MSFQIEMKVCGYTVYNVGGHRLTSNKNGLNDYEYVVWHSSSDFVGSRDVSRDCTISELSSGEIQHQYEDGLISLCKKILEKIETELEEENV